MLEFDGIRNQAIPFLIQHYLNILMRQDGLDQRDVAVDRDALVLDRVIIVIVIEAHRQPIQHRCRDLAGAPVPLFLPVPFKKP